MSSSTSTPQVFLAPLPARHAPLLADLDRWVAQGWLRQLDRSFAAFLAQQAPDADPLLILAAAWASHQLGRGHACLDLRLALDDAGRALALPPEGARRVEEGDDAAPANPAALLADVDLPRWLAALAHPALVGDGPGNSPLVRVGHRLYLRRYWQYEQSVSQAIRQRVQHLTPAAQPQGQAALRQALDTLFPPGSPGVDWQKVACALAARQHFSIVTGGPGTGKTTTVVKLLALLQSQALAASGRKLRIRLAAPTGKAAARLNESIAKAVDKKEIDGLPDAAAVRAAIPLDVTTVHRLLGSRPDTRHFRHHARNLLALDVLVIDEASMLDLEMMASVLAALPPQARLILLGDKDQLASVEAGAVLGDLCLRADAGHYREDTVAWLQAAAGETVPDALQDAGGAPLDQAVTKLRVSHRFQAGSGIGRLAEAVNDGDPAAVEAVFRQRALDLARQRVLDDAALRRLVLDGGAGVFSNRAGGPSSGDLFSEAIGSAVGAASSPVGYGHYLHLMRARQPAPDAPQHAFDTWAREVLKAYGEFQLLCALRSGPFGVEGLNHRIAGLLRAEGLLEPEQGGWMPGRPVLVTRNDYGLGLMNGDVGVALSLPGATLRVAFSSAEAEGGIRWVLPSRLQSVQTVFAMTVHKSQGSEFTHAALLLPPAMSPVLTRELVYTGITRAKKWFTLVDDPATLRQAVQRRVDRMGGLAQALGAMDEAG